MNEGKVIKIIRQRQRELVGVAQPVMGELVCSSAVVFFSSDLCVCFSSLACGGIQQPEVAISSLSLFSRSF